MNDNMQLVKTPVEKEVSYVPFGSQDKIKLTVSIIKNLVAVQTKSGKTCDDKQAMKFMALCAAQHLNPFAGDAFLIGYDGKDGPQFSLITAHQAFLKRAEVSKDYDGMESGVIVRSNETGQIQEVEGDFFDNQTHKLLGGWAVVHHKARKIPTKRRVRLERFQKPFGVWQDDPGGMICKCAEADALRSTFPTMLGGLYSQGEVIDLPAEPATERVSRLVSVASEPSNGEQPEPKGEPTQEEVTPQAQLEKVITEAGCSLDNLLAWGRDSGNIDGADSIPDFQSIPSQVCNRLLRNKAGLLKSLQSVKGAA